MFCNKLLTRTSHNLLTPFYHVNHASNSKAYDKATIPLITMHKLLSSMSSTMICDSERINWAIQTLTTLPTASRKSQGEG
jgi:hypothetical protein